MDSLKDRKQAMSIIVEPYFKNQCFLKIANYLPISYVKRCDKEVFIITFEFMAKSDSHYSSPIMIHFKNVEDLIKEVGIPKYDFSILQKDIDYSRTISKDFSETYNQKFSELNLKTLEGFKQWAYLIIEYMEGEGKKFMEYYSYLPNVLKEMDRLEAEGEMWKEFIIAGSPIWFFRGLIISKLCNDPNFGSKKNWVDTIYYDTQYELDEWLPYYEKLKQKLKSVEPIYNV